MRQMRRGQGIRSAAVGCLVAASVVGAACGGSQANSAVVDRSGTITVWEDWQGAQLDTNTSIFAAYMKQYPNVTIKLVHKDDVASAFTTGAAAGQGPDVVALTDDYIGKLARLKAIKPVDGIDGVDASYMNASFTKASVDADTLNGRFYGLPETVETITMVYNRAFLNAAQVPKTTDQLYALANNWHLTHPGMYGVVWNARNDGYYNAPWVYGFGGYYVKPDGAVGLTSPGTRTAFNYIASFRRLLPAGVDYGVADTLFKEKKAAIVINGPWSTASYAAAGIDYGLAVLPTTRTGKPAQPFVGVNTLMLSASAQNPGLAVDVMKWLDNRDSEVSQALSGHEIPVNQAALTDSRVQAVPDLKGFAAQMASGTPLPNTPYMSALWDPISTALESVWAGRSVDAALSDAQTAAEKNVSLLK